MDCVFCQIVAGKIPADIIYQDKEIIAFRDIHPQTPVHVLIVPRKHIPSLAQLADSDVCLVGEMARVANEVARREGIFEAGYRVVVNVGKGGGQVVLHLHMHLLGGLRLKDGLA